MKNMKKYLLFAVALVCLGQAAQARRDDVRHEALVIEKGQTLHEDIVIDKSLTINGTLNGDVSAINGASVTVNGELIGDLAVLGGGVSIPGTVKGDVSNVGGPLDISGKVTGDISAVGGKVTLSGTGEVDGDISALGGTLVKGEKAVSKGSVNNFDARAIRKTLTRVLRIPSYSGGYNHNANPWFIGGLVGLGLMVLFSALVTGVILMLLPAVFFPSNVETSAKAMTGDMWKAAWVGALMLMGFFPGLIIMVVSVFGIPLLPFALMIFAAAAVLGLSAFSVVLQARFFEGIKKAGPVGLASKVAVGYAIMAGLMFFGKLIPLVGGILSMVGFMLMAFGTMIGLGAAWMTKMGSRVYTLPPPFVLQAQPAVVPAVVQPVIPPTVPPAQ